MNKPPFSFDLALDDIDTSEYPKEAKKIGSPSFKKHFRKSVEHDYKGIEGKLDIKFYKDTVSVSWQPKIAPNQKNTIFSLLQKGEVKQAQPLLEQLLQAEPNDLDALYNLGMIYSDQGKLAKAIELLTKATQQDPKHNHAFVALGVAHLRLNQEIEGEVALKAAHSIDSDDPYTLRTLAAIYMKRQEHVPAISMLRHSLSLLPNDPISLLNLATTLLKTEQEKDTQEADNILTNLLNTNTTVEVEEKAKDLKRQIAHLIFRRHGEDAIRPDAVMYCLDALKKLDGLEQKKIAEIAMELAQKGEQGLNVNDPSTSYTIKSFEGPFTGLALVCLLHVAIQKVSPGSDSGFDVQREYEEALTQHAT